MIAYKVLKNMKSSGIANENGEVRYKWKKINKPNKNCGPLCCFSNIDDATAYSNISVITYNGLIISLAGNVYKVKIKPSKQKNVWIKCNKTFTVKTTISNLPKNTILADEVILLKKIK